MPETSFQQRTPRSSRARAAASVATATLGLSFIAAGIGAPATAATTCPAGSTLVSAGVCEVVLTSTPVSPWTPPAGITKLQALLVGAGGAGMSEFALSYGGGGGEVVIATLATTGDVTIQVGVPGTQPSYVAGNDSTVTQGATTTAEGGKPAESPFVITSPGGASGSGFSANVWGGSGAGAAATSNSGGSGAVVSSLPGAATSLFAGDSTCYGGGGAGESGTATCGGGTESALPVANSGGGGSVTPGTPDVSQNGASGVVIIRFQLPPTLAETGPANVSGSLLAAGLLALGGAGLLAANGRRRARTN